MWIPSGFHPPAEHNLNQQLGYSPRVHNVGADAVIIVDDKTIRIENLDYDGNAPGKFIQSAQAYYLSKKKQNKQTKLY